MGETKPSQLTATKLKRVAQLSGGNPGVHWLNATCEQGVAHRVFPRTGWKKVRGNRSNDKGGVREGPR